MSRRSFSVGWCLAATLLVLTLLASTYSALRIAAADFQGLPARLQLRSWQTGQKVVIKQEAWQKTYDALNAARRIAPHNPSLSEDLGLLLWIRGQQTDSLPPIARIFYDEALAAYAQALRLNPNSATAWANSAAILHAQSRPAMLEGTFADPAARDQAGTDLRREIWQLFDTAMALGPNEPDVQLVLNRIAADRWNELPAARQEALRAHWQQANPALKAILALPLPYLQQSSAQAN